MAEAVKILVVDDDPQFSRFIEMLLLQSGKGCFSVTMCGDATSTLGLLKRDSTFDVILLDYYLPGMNGDALIRTLIENGVYVPVIFVTVIKEFRLAVEAMKLGVYNYLVKENLTAQTLIKSVYNVVERNRLRQELSTLEVSTNRLEAIQELVFDISRNLVEPIAAMRRDVAELQKNPGLGDMHTYLRIISDNIERMQAKLDKLKMLKEDKTIEYVKNIRMLDLS
ncbi:MAG: response regulator [Acidobacteriota bacterium]